MEKWLRPVIKDLGTTNRLSDCRFKIEADDGSEHIFECHKFIFSCPSIIFERMFYGDFLESNSNEICLINVRPDIFAIFREYLYTYDIKLLEGYDEDTLIELAQLAHLYMVSSLTEECIKILFQRIENANIEILIRLYQFGNDILHEDLIQKVSENITFRRPKSLNHSAIYHLSSNVFFKYMELIEDKLKEVKRFKMISKYLEINGFVMKIVISSPSDQEDLRNTDKNIFTFINNKNAYVRNLLKLINYKRMDPKEFFYVPGRSQYFDLKDKYKMLYATSFSYEFLERIN